MKFKPSMPSLKLTSRILLENPTNVLKMRIFSEVIKGLFSTVVMRKFEGAKWKFFVQESTFTPKIKCSKKTFLQVLCVWPF